MRGDPSSRSREKPRLVFSTKTPRLSTGPLHFVSSWRCFAGYFASRLSEQKRGTNEKQTAAEVARMSRFHTNCLQLSWKSTSESAAPFQTLLVVLTADEDAFVKTAAERGRFQVHCIQRYLA